MKIDEILEGIMIVDKNHNWKIQTGMLMELYRYNSYASEEDVIEDGGTPQKIKVQIQVSLEEIT